MFYKTIKRSLEELAMFKITVMYPPSSSPKFDHEYYKTTHMPLVQRLLGPGCLNYTIDKGLAGGSPDSAPPFLAMCHIFTDSMEAFQSGMAAHSAQLFADIPNFTNSETIVQISEVVVG